MSDGSSPDNDVIIKAPWVRAVKKKNSELLRAMENGEIETPDDMMLSFEGRSKCQDAESNGRSSPPLYEVELTASDEDDDGSVLELVIPVQLNSRYQRVPTSSPNKTQPKIQSVLTGFFCCLRK